MTVLFVTKVLAGTFAKTFSMGVNLHFSDSTRSINRSTAAQGLPAVAVGRVQAILKIPTDVSMTNVSPVVPFHRPADCMRLVRYVTELGGAVKSGRNGCR